MLSHAGGVLTSLLSDDDVSESEVLSEVLLDELSPDAVVLLSELSEVLSFGGFSREPSSDGLSPPVLFSEEAPL